MSSLSISRENRVLHLRKCDRSRVVSNVSLIAVRTSRRGSSPFGELSGKSYHTQNSPPGNFARARVLVLQCSLALSSQSETQVKADSNMHEF